MKKTLEKTKLLMLVILATGVATLFSLSTAQATDVYWDAGGGGDTNWNTPANWNINISGTNYDLAPGAGDNALISYGTVTVTSDVGSSGSRLGNIELGRWWGSGTLTQTAGTVYASSLTLGLAGVGVYNLNGTGSLNLSSDLYLGLASSGFNGVGTFSMNTTGTLSTNYVHIADSAWGDPSVSGSFSMVAGTLNSTYGFTVGGWSSANGGVGAMTISGGVVNSNGNFVIGGAQWWSNAANGVFVMTGGTLNVTGANGTEFQVGNGHNSGNDSIRGTGTATISSGVLNVGSWFGVGRDGGNGTLTISGDAVVNQGVTDSGSWLELGNFGNNNVSVLNLNGGTLAVNGIRDGGGAGDSTTFNWNGGTLKARQDNSDFLNADTINIQNGGAVIDSNGHSIKINSPLVASGTGGLTKNGNGQLEIASSGNTFTGAVVVNSGTLYATSAGWINSGAFGTSSGITVNSGATLKANGNSLFTYDGSKAKPITINGGTAITAGGDQVASLLTLNGGTLASEGSIDSYWGSWNFGRNATDKKLLVTDDSTVSAEHVSFYNGATIEVAAGKNLNFTGTIGDGGDYGASSVIKTGSGTLTLAGSNTFTGTTTITSGTLVAASSTGGSLGSTTSVTVNTDGTLLLGGSNQINDSASVTLSGGKLNTGGYNEKVGALTLSANSTIDFSNGQGTLTFDSASYTGGTLTILNWAGNSGGGTTDHLLLNSAASGTFLSNVNFAGFGTGANQIPFGGSQYEVVPIPEPSTIIGAFAVVGLMVLRERRWLTFLPR